MEVGTIVRSLKGRDAGYLLCVVGTKEEFVLVADGKERPLEHPKQKNPKHLQAVDGAAPLGHEALRGNHALRKTLNRLTKKG